MPLVVVVRPDLCKRLHEKTGTTRSKLPVVDTKLEPYHTIKERIPDTLESPPDTRKSAQNRSSKMSPREHRYRLY